MRCLRHFLWCDFKFEEEERETESRKISKIDGNEIEYFLVFTIWRQCNENKPAAMLASVCVCTLVLSHQTMKMWYWLSIHTHTHGLNVFCVLCIIFQVDGKFAALRLLLHAFWIISTVFMRYWALLFIVMNVSYPQTHKKYRHRFDKEKKTR